VGKGAVALGLLQKLDEAHLDAEDVLLAELLGQKRWRRGRRGRWWDRRITLAMKPKFKDEAGRQRALVILEDAIRDPDTHLRSYHDSSCDQHHVLTSATVYRPKFDRHMTTIEKALQIPEADRHSCEGVQYRSTANAIQGTRVRPRTASLSLDSRGRALSTALETTQRTLAEYGVTQTQALAETPEAS
jgi:Fanconi-associated nuclease 1